MDSRVIWRIALWLVALLGLLLTVILYVFYATGRFSDSTICQLISCLATNGQTYQIANYSFTYQGQNHYLTKDYPLNQNCSSQVTCYFTDPNAPSFNKQDNVPSLATGLALVLAMMIFISFGTLIPFEYCWQRRLANRRRLIDDYQQID